MYDLGGKVALITGAGSGRGKPYNGAHSVTKYAAIGLTQTLALAPPDGIRIVVASNLPERASTTRRVQWIR